MRNIFLLVSALFMSSVVFAQQDAMFTHYMFNTLYVNPAYAGSRDVTTVTGLHRSQWVGFDGAPITQTLTLHSPVFSESFSVGLSFVNDKIGPVKQTNFYADLSYRIKLTAETRLAFGLKGGGGLLQADLGRLETTSDNDNAFIGSSNDFMPNVGLGVYLSNPRWYVGGSIPKLLENEMKTGLTGGLNKESRHYFLIGGFVTNLSNSIKLKPTTFLKATKGAPIIGDLTAMFIFKDKLELGLMGRTGAGLGALLGYNFSPQLRVGYSFDWSFVNETGKYNSGSHEVMLRYDIINVEKGKIRSPRYF